MHSTKNSQEISGSDLHNLRHDYGCEELLRGKDTTQTL